MSVIYPQFSPEMVDILRRLWNPVVGELPAYALRDAIGYARWVNSVYPQASMFRNVSPVLAWSEINALVRVGPSLVITTGARSCNLVVALLEGRDIAARLRRIGTGSAALRPFASAIAPPSQELIERLAFGFPFNNVLPPTVDDGMISVRNNPVVADASGDLGRTGTSSTIYFVPSIPRNRVTVVNRGRGGSTSNMFEMSLLARVSLCFRGPSEDQVYAADVPICKAQELNGNVRLLLPSCRLDTTSPIPFQYDAGKLPSQTAANTFKPTDLFISCPASVLLGTPPRTQTDALDRLTTAGDPHIVMFYMNWYSDTVRDNGLTGAARVGHGLVQRGNRYYLDAPHTSANGYVVNQRMAEPKFYLYVGTVYNLLPGIATCLPKQRLVYSEYNRIGYNDFGVDSTPLWLLDPLLATDTNFNNGVRYMPMNDRSPMTWWHVYLDPGNATNPKRTILGGSAQVTYAGLNGVIAYNGNTRMSGTSFAETPSPNGPAIQIYPQVHRLNNLGNPAATSPRVGLNVIGIWKYFYGDWRAAFNDPLLRYNTQPPRWGFVGDGSQVRHHVRYGIFQPDKAPLDSVLNDLTIGTARMNIIGEC